MRAKEDSEHQTLAEAKNDAPGADAPVKEASYNESGAPLTATETDWLAAQQIDSAQQEVNLESETMTKVPKEVSKEDKEKKTEDEDPVVAKLKRRIESMVDKLEVQLSQVQVKIGDKLHFLDKDRDGVLSREEMADVLQQVLKRKITFEEAMEIASEMVSQESIPSHETEEFLVAHMTHPLARMRIEMVFSLLMN
jgi:hypothetical protein